MQDRMDIDIKALKADKELLKELFTTLHLRIENVHQENQGISEIHIPFRLDDFYHLEALNQEDKLFVMRQNLIDMALLVIATYSDCEQYFSDQYFASRKKMLEDPTYFNEFAKYLPQEDIAYYHIILYQNTIYYYSQYQQSDYYQAMTANNSYQLSTQEGNATNMGKSYVLSNPYGKLFMDDPTTVTPEKAGFIKILVLPGIMITTVVLFTLLFLIKYR